MNSVQFQFIKSISDNLVTRFHFGRDVADFIGCQFALESNYGVSRVAKINNNFCGMKIAYSRISTQLVSVGVNPFGVYSSLQDCILDFVLRMQYFKPISDDYKKLGSYQKFNEKTCYCPEKTYNMRINNIYQQFKTFQNEREN